MYNIKYLLILPAFLIFSCASPAKEDPAIDHSAVQAHAEDSTIVKLTEEQAKIAGITTGTITHREISGTFRASGVLDVPPQQQVSVSVPLGGFLKNTSLLQGMRVKKGQLLATIENPEYVQMQQDYLEAKSQLEFSRADYERQQELARENVNARKT